MKKSIINSYTDEEFIELFYRSKTLYEFYKNNGKYICAICGYTNYCELAHIKSVSSFDDNSLIQEINDFYNLIPLCPNHHWEYDNGLLDLNTITNLRHN